MQYIVKKTVSLIIKGKNNYLIGVKGNQKDLLRTIAGNTAGKALSRHISHERSRGRDEKRIVSVYNNRKGISPVWTGLRSVIKVERSRLEKGKRSEEIAYFISSLLITSKGFSEAIRLHWGIENRLHWVKDVVLKEDDSKINSGNAPECMSAIRNIVIDLVRLKGHASLTVAQRMISHDLDKLFEIVE
jgi:predicted transposase YbfD/YdcC